MKPSKATTAPEKKPARVSGKRPDRKSNKTPATTSKQQTGRKPGLVIGITAPQSVVLLKGQPRYFTELGHKVYLLAPSTKKTVAFCREEKCTLLPVNLKREISPFRDLLALLRILYLLIKVKPEIVNLGTPKVSLLGMIAARILGVRLRVYTCRGFRFEHEKGIFRRILIAMEKVTARSAHQVIAISESVRQMGIDEGIFLPEKVRVLGMGSSNGIDLGMFNRGRVTRSEQEKLLETYSLEGRFVFGYLGRIIGRKGFSELFEAFDRVYAKDPACRLLVVGKPYYDQMDRQVIDRARAHPGILMTGAVEFNLIPLHLSLMHILVLPAHWEGFGNVLIQAAAMGIPVISTPVTGCKDAVSNGYNGILVPEKDVDLLASVLELLKSDKELRDIYGKNGIRWAGNFRSEALWEKMERLYTDGESTHVPETH